ncbi:MAG TPA: Pycsar system effector family protein [Cytophagaceae bacterium]|jgi:predicted metal-dependent HD superfamily phosphohydrolase
MEKQDTIVEEANKYIFYLFKEKLSSDYVYHNYQHTLETVEACEILIKGYDLKEEEKDILLISAWFHDAGYVFQYAGHEEKSKEIAKDFLEQKQYSPEFIAEVIKCIESTKREAQPHNLLAQILCDADLINIGDKGFFKKAELLRAEWEAFKYRACNEIEWAQTQLNFLQSTNFHTREAQRLYGEQLLLNVQQQRKHLKKVLKKDNKKTKDKNKSKAQPKRGIETMFRSIYNSHINLSSMADSKANMMISINSLIISITLTLVGAKVSMLGPSFKQNQIVIYPVITLLLTSLGSIIFAILSAKPKVTDKITNLDQLKQSNASVLFFGNFSNLKISDFEIEIREIMKYEDKLYGNMIHDLYYLGKVLSTKYNLIRWSYLVFMYGLILTVLTIIAVIIVLKETDGR